MLLLGQTKGGRPLNTYFLIYEANAESNASDSECLGSDRHVRNFRLFWCTATVAGGGVTHILFRA